MKPFAAVGWVAGIGVSALCSWIMWRDWNSLSRAQAACAGEARAASVAHAEYTSFDPASEPELRAPVTADQVSAADRSAYLDGKVRYWWVTQENCSGFGWNDVIDRTIHTYQDATVDPSAERSGEVITCRYRDRRATDGDHKKLDLRRAKDRAEGQLNACVERVCKPVADELAKATRVHELHSSESTARELVDAEEALKACQHIANEDEQPLAR